MELHVLGHERTHLSKVFLFPTFFVFVVCVCVREYTPPTPMCVIREVVYWQFSRSEMRTHVYEFAI